MISAHNISPNTNTPRPPTSLVDVRTKLPALSLVIIEILANVKQRLPNLPHLHETSDECNGGKK